MQERVLVVLAVRGAGAGGESIVTSSGSTDSRAGIRWVIRIMVTGPNPLLIGKLILTVSAIEIILEILSPHQLSRYLKAVPYLSQDEKDG